MNQIRNQFNSRPAATKSLLRNVWLGIPYQKTNSLSRCNCLRGRRRLKKRRRRLRTRLTYVDVDVVVVDGVVDVGSNF